MDLEDILEQIDQLKRHQTKQFGGSLKKPLFLLLILAELQKEERRNRFNFAEVEEELTRLIKHFGNRPASPAPQQPFFHLSSSDLWNVIAPDHIHLTLRTTPPKSILKRADVYGQLNEDVYNVLVKDSLARNHVANYILQKYWPVTVQDELRAYFGFSFYVTKTRKRDAEFAEKVIENFDNKCAICGFKAVFNDRVFGLDGAHILWHSFDGPNDLDNGLSLCKIHHWAFDRGVVSVDSSLKVQVSKHFVQHDNVSQQLIAQLEGRMIQQPKYEWPSEEHLRWHRENVFIV